MKNQAKLLGIAASLRNARWGLGNRDLVESLKAIKTEEELKGFLTRESEQHLENFLEAGRREKKPFLEIYSNLRKEAGNKGLSNSEVALAAALWSAHQKGVEIDHISLAEYFTAWGSVRNLDELKRKLMESDGFLISGPVYFGDRGSLAHSLIELIRQDEELRAGLRGKLYGGIAVGAKRNGGQETTLIYQMLDMVSLGLLAIGNDSETTSQYGGTGHAGDVGTMHKDEYGLWTSMGTGRRISSLLRKLHYGRELQGPVKVLFWILQDADGLAKNCVQQLIRNCGEPLEAMILDIADRNIMRCLACDICPTHIDVDDVYRCIIRSDHDDMHAIHQSLLNYDAVVPVTVSVRDSKAVKSNYQTFIERTRYLRRGDYIFSDLLTAPLVIEELGVREYYDIRMLTSLIRHHTVMGKPMVGYLQKGGLLNGSFLEDDFKKFIVAAKRLVAARLAEVDETGNTKYNPVGYVLSVQKDLEDERLKKREDMIKRRNEILSQEAAQRLKPTFIPIG